MAVPVLDNHVHLEPVKGRNVDAVREFERAGGTHIIISNMPYQDIPARTVDDFRKSYDVTISTKDRVNKETGVKAFATVGPYPGDLIDLEAIHGLEKAKEIMLEAMDIAAEYVKAGKALAIGEVGRPHFPVSRDAWSVSNDILRYGMKAAKDVGCAIVIHTERATPETMKEQAEMADRVGLERRRVVKHFCPPFVLPEENHGLMPSVLVGKDAANVALSKGTRFLMETDFMDDPTRPGAVLAIGTVPKRTLTLMKQGLMSEEQAHKIHMDAPREAYGQAFA